MRQLPLCSTVVNYFNKVIEMVIIVTFGMLQEQTYLYIDETPDHGFVIVPGAEPKKILQVIEA